MNPDCLAGFRCSRQQPGRRAVISGYPVGVLAIVNVRDAGKTSRESITNSALADVASTPWFHPTRHIELAVIRKKVHDGVEIVGVEGSQERLEGLGGDRWVFTRRTCLIHVAASPFAGAARFAHQAFASEPVHGALPIEAPNASLKSSISE